MKQNVVKKFSFFYSTAGGDPDMEYVVKIPILLLIFSPEYAQIAPDANLILYLVPDE